MKAAGTAAANETIKKIKYLEGGFLDKMTRREAGQILGIRFVVSLYHAPKYAEDCARSC